MEEMKDKTTLIQTCDAYEELLGKVFSVKNVEKRNNYIQQIKDFIVDNYEVLNEESSYINLIVKLITLMEGENE